MGELFDGSGHTHSSTWPPLATDCTVSPFLLQPAKLAEAFKYFVQGMGYSKYGVSHRRRAEGQAWEWEYDTLGQGWMSVLDSHQDVILDLDDDRPFKLQEDDRW